VQSKAKRRLQDLAAHGSELDLQCSVMYSHLRLEKSEARALRITHNGDASHGWDVEGRHHNASAKCGNLLGGRVNVFTGDMSEPVGGQARLWTFHHTAHHHATFLEQCVCLAAAAKRFGRPFKEAGVKSSGGGFVCGNQLIPTEQAGSEALVFADHIFRWVAVLLAGELRGELSRAFWFKADATGRLRLLCLVRDRLFRWRRKLPARTQFLE